MVFPENSRVCFLGDSITHINGFVSHIVAFYRKNYKNISFYNCGVAGGSVGTLLSILDEDVLVHKPTHAVIMIGINDSSRDVLRKPKSKERYDTLCNAYEKYKSNLNKLCSILRQNNIEIIMCTPTPYDEYQNSEVTVNPGGFALMAGYAEYVRDFAAKNGFELCDYHKYFTQKMQEEELYETDRVHPNDNGHYHIAKCFLSFQGLEIGKREPFPEFMSRWRELIHMQRDIRAAEHCIIGDDELAELSTEQRIEKVKKFIEDDADNPFRQALLEWAYSYLKNKPIQTEIEAELNTIFAQ